MTWKTLQHPNILPLIGVTVSEAHFAMVSEWMANGNVNEFVKETPDANRLKLVGSSFHIPHHSFFTGLTGIRTTYPARGCCQRVDLYPSPGNDSWGPQGRTFLTLRAAPFSNRIHLSRQTSWLTKLAMPGWQTLDSSQSSQTLQIFFPQAHPHKVVQLDGRARNSSHRSGLG